MDKPWSVYILRCADGSLYTGISNDVARRLAAHNAGRGARYVRTRCPAELVFCEPAGDRGAALKREAAIKKFSRPMKERLVFAGGFDPAALAGPESVAVKPVRCGAQPAVPGKNPVRWFHL